jgi:hypothetical protein
MYMKLVCCLGMECRPRVQNYAASRKSSGSRRNSALEASAIIKKHHRGSITDLNSILKDMAQLELEVQLNRSISSSGKVVVEAGLPRV